ncbi:unnamed protein product [Rhizophagus irregularis]|nr:unnamed protein product [Rhizophagus irregularis]
MKLEDEKKYSLVLEYANGGTLREHLRNKTITFKWEDQLRFAKELASAALWLHDYKEIIHGDLHPDNILIHRDTIKLADFGRSFEKGKDCTTTKIWGGAREEPVKDTNNKFVVLYEKCWQHEPNNRPDISEVISELNFINPENEDVSAITLKKSENGTTEDLCLPD